MLKKRKMRELAMQILFLWDTNGAQDVDLARQVVTDGTDDASIRALALEWAAGAWEQREISDTRVARLAPQWPIHRQPGVDKVAVSLTHEQAMRSVELWATQVMPHYRAAALVL